MRRYGARSLDEPGAWLQVSADADDLVPADADDRIGKHPQCFPILGMQTSQRL